MHVKYSNVLQIQNYTTALFVLFPVNVWLEIDQHKEYTLQVVDFDLNCSYALPELNGTLRILKRARGDVYPQGKNNKVLMFSPQGTGQGLFMERSFTKKKMQIINIRIKYYGSAIPVRKLVKRKVTDPFTLSLFVAMYDIFLSIIIPFNNNLRTWMSLVTRQYTSTVRVYGKPLTIEQKNRYAYILINKKCSS